MHAALAARRASSRSPRSLSDSALATRRAEARPRCARRESIRSRTPSPAWSRAPRLTERGGPHGSPAACRAAGRREGDVPRPRRPGRPDPAARRPRGLGDESFEQLKKQVDLGDLIGVDGTPLRTDAGSPPCSSRLDPAGQGAAAAAGEVPRGPGHRAALPPARAGPDGQRGVPRGLPHPRAADLRHPRASSTTRVSRGRDAGPAAALRRRGGAAVHDALQRARPDDVPAHRHGALPQALHRRRFRARLRDRQELPQRGAVAQAHPRVHDARVLRGLRGLQGRRGVASSACWLPSTPSIGRRATSSPVAAGQVRRRRSRPPRGRHHGPPVARRAPGRRRRRRPRGARARIRPGRCWSITC